MKNKGGRGRKNQHKTKMMRIPEPIATEIQNIVNGFYGIPHHHPHQLPASLVADWIIAGLDPNCSLQLLLRR